MLISDKIRPYSVKVIWDEDVVGSGILVKSKDNQSYLFTARHLFKKGLGTNFKNVKEFHIKKRINQISINRESFKKEIYVNEILFFRDDLDLIVFSLKEEPPIKHLAIIKVLKNGHQVQDYHFHGYPKGAINSIDKKYTGHPESAQYIQSNEEESHIFRLSPKKNFGGDDVSGYSGSGVFVENKETTKVGDDVIETSIVYLVGILIRAKEGLSYYEAIDLSEIIDDINRKANIEILTIEDALDTKFTKNIKTKILNRNKENTFIQKFENLDNEENKNILKEFLDNSENELTEMTKKLADFYLLGGMAYKDDGYDESAKKYFRLATKFNANYKRYQKNYKGKDDDIEELPEESSKNYYHLGIINFHHKNYSEAKENFLEHLKKDNVDSFEKIETHKYLSKIYEYEKMYAEAIQESKLVLSLYQDENIVDKMETTYRLSKLCLESESDKIDAFGYIEKGLSLIELFEDKFKDEKNKKDETFLDLKYKIKLLRDKLYEDNSEKTINSTLIDLVRLNPDKYMEEFLEAYLKTQNGEITPTVIYQKLQEVHLDVKGLRNNGKKN